jgi:raffinose/stachyose/melibiose transport system permease protein
VNRDRRAMTKRKWAIWFLIPAFAFYIFVVVVPSLRGVLFAFTDWSGLSPDRKFIGLTQFKRVFEDSDSSGALKHTFFIAVGITVFQNLVGLLFALGLYSKIKSRNILRTMFFAPAIVAPVATAYLWQYMFAPAGPINTILEQIGLGSLAQDWLGNPAVVLWSIIIVVIWQFAGYSMVIYLAGLEGVPKEIIEAAEIDGAGYWKRFWFVVRPFLYPAITVTLMLSIIGGFKLFDQVYILTGGGPGQASQTISTMMYRNAFQFGEFAYSTALAVLLTIIVAAFSSIQYFFITRTDKS